MITLTEYANTIAFPQWFRFLLTFLSLVAAVLTGWSITTALVGGERVMFTIMATILLWVIIDSTVTFILRMVSFFYLFFTVPYHRYAMTQFQKGAITILSEEEYLMTQSVDDDTSAK